MSIYHCDLCGMLCDCDENPCHESHVSEYGLICDDCECECACRFCEVYDKDIKYCKITDQYYHDKCI